MADNSSALWSREAHDVEPRTSGNHEAAAGGEGAGSAGLDAAFQLNVEEGGMVEAQFPFFGDEEAGQLSFQIGDSIKVLDKDELWSWGQLVRTGEEGWFPHNYVTKKFKPLPGMHELQMKMRIKKAREEAIARGEDPDAAEALIRAEMAGPAAPETQDPPSMEQPAPIEEGWQQQTMAGMNQYGYPQQQPAFDPNFGMGGFPVQPQPMGEVWSNPEDVDMAFGMWLEHLDEQKSPVKQKAEEVAEHPDSGKKHHLRMKAIRDLVDSEEAYVGMLGAMMDTIVDPSRGRGGGRPALSPQEFHEIFGVLNAEEIFDINTGLRDQLRGKMKTLNEDTCFGDVFIRLAPFLKTYVEYCTQHEGSASRLGLMATKNDRLRALLRKSMDDPRCRGEDAQGLLIRPIKRIPEYKTLLETMYRHTESSHPDHPLLRQAIDDIADVASFINDSIKRRENQSKIWGIQAMLSERIDLAKPSRIYIKSGILTKLGKMTDRKDYFALFNDGLLHARPSRYGNKFIFKRMTQVLRVEEVGYLKSKPKALHAFRLVTDGHIYLLSAATPHEKTAWMRVLTQVIKGGKRKLVHKGVLGMLRPDKDPFEIRDEYFYVFSDVVVRGKSLWQGKFKHKETIDLQHVEERVAFDPIYDVGIPREFATSKAMTQCFRLVATGGHSIIVLAHNASERAEWLSALRKMLQDKRQESSAAAAPSSRDADFEDSEDEKEDTPTRRRGRGKGSAGAKISSPSDASGAEPPVVDLLGLSLDDKPSPMTPGTHLASGNGSVQQSLLESDLATILGSPTQAFQQQQLLPFPPPSSQYMSQQPPVALPSSRSSVPLLQPPSWDTPPFRQQQQPLPPHQGAGYVQQPQAIGMGSPAAQQWSNPAAAYISSSFNGMSAMGDWGKQQQQQQQQPPQQMAYQPQFAQPGRGGGFSHPEYPPRQGQQQNLQQQGQGQYMPNRFQGGAR